MALEFEERIQKIIADGLKHIEDEKRLDGEFAREWVDARRTVWSVLARAKKAAQQTPFDALQPDQTNGCTVLNLLEGSPRGAVVTHALKFCPDETTRTIVCSVKPTDLIPEGEGFPESFTLDALTEAVIESKTEAFFDAILKRMADKRPPKRRSVVLR